MYIFIRTYAKNVINLSAKLWILPLVELYHDFRFASNEDEIFLTSTFEAPFDTKC